ncbi:uncharacterized protein QC761_109065 [Podospora bellae-mahoneyi]|uniref:Uncharacterized protein n=1 Tax=Podospora bellae-mahoneyi TaxID=2093777 RepID=A0ABR0FWI1_9PEZI|nr:hypothetical protein QC761_109065 [Podospora bellae-mahoneyi]
MLLWLHLLLVELEKSTFSKLHIKVVPPHQFDTSLLCQDRKRPAFSLVSVRNSIQKPAMSTDLTMSDLPDLSTPPIQTPQHQHQHPPAGKPLASWNTPKFREEYENTRARLQHGDFSCSALPDPLAPRPAIATHSRFDPQTEERLKGVLRAAKESVQGGGSS